MFSSWMVAVEKLAAAQTASKKRADERGAVLVEHAFILILVVAVAMTMLAVFGIKVFELFSDNTAKFSDAVGLSKN